MNFAHATSLVDILQWRASHQPEEVVYHFLVNGEVEKEITLSYEELDRQARNIACILQKSGPCGKRVLLLYPSGIDYIVAFFACLYARDIAVPAYPPHPNRSLQRLQAIVADSQASIVLTNAVSSPQLKLLFTDNPIFADLQMFVTDELPMGNEDAWERPVLTKSILAFLQYTSGSTGNPKGVMVSHHNLVYNSAYMYTAFSYHAESKIVSWLPPFHDMGLILGLLQPVYGGIPGILMAPAAFLQRPVRWLRAIAHFRATSSPAPNFAYDLCAERITREQINELDLSCWATAINGAEPVRSTTLEKFSSTFAPCGFHPEACLPGYGLAEATLMVSGGLTTARPITYRVDPKELIHNRVVEAHPQDNDAQILVGCGKTWLDGRIEIVAPDSCVKCEPGTVGEIWVSGTSIAQGYWNLPQETERVFHAFITDTHEGPFLRTGDLGFLKDGELFITGRLKDLIIIDGRNYYPQDIELIVEQCHPTLRTNGCAAFSIDVLGQERVVVVIEVDRHYRPTVHFSPENQSAVLVDDTIVQACRLAVIKQLDIPIFSLALLKPGGLLKTTSGKIQRRACREAFLAGTLLEWGRA